MKYLFLWIAFWSTNSILAQDKREPLVKILNECLTSFSEDNPMPMTFFKVSSILEQKIEGRTQRLSLDNIHTVRATENKSVIAVEIICANSTACIHLVKEDMSSSDMNSTSFFFTNAAAANTFALSLKQIIELSQSTPSPVQLSLISSPDGKRPMLPSASLPKEDKLAEKPTNESPTINTASAPPSKSPLQISDDEDKPTSQSKLPNKGSEAPIREKSAARERSDSKQDKEDTDDEDNAGSAFCNQLLAIIKSAEFSNFRDIEGKELGADSKALESKIRFKGTRRCYINQLGGKKAFVAEIKSYASNELAIDAFFEWQTLINECLADGWDDEDKSDDPAYEKLEIEMKDVEYRHSTSASKPAVRLAIAPEGKRFTLFIRVMQ